jgi:hypothetical protein
VDAVSQSCGLLFAGTSRVGRLGVGNTLRVLQCALAGTIKEVARNYLFLIGAGNTLRVLQCALAGTIKEVARN